MFKRAVFSFAFVLFVTSGFCADPKAKDSKQPIPAAVGAETQNVGGEAAPAPNAAEVGNRKNIAASGTQENSSIAAAKTDNPKPTPSSTVLQTSIAPSVADNRGGASNKSPVKTASSDTSETVAKTQQPLSKTPSASGGIASDKTTDAAKTNTQTKTTGDDKTAKAPPPASVPSSKTAAEKAGKKPPESKAQAASIDKAKGKDGQDGSESAAQPPPPIPDDDQEVGDASNSNLLVKNKNDGLGVEENDDLPVEKVESNKPVKESKVKADEVKGSRKEEAVPNENPVKMRYDDEPENSHFLAYLLTIGVLCIAAYVVAHNRHKIMGLILEGRQGRRTSRSGSTGSRGVKYKRLQHEEAEGDNDVSLSSRDGGRVIY